MTFIAKWYKKRRENSGYDVDMGYKGASVVKEMEQKRNEGRRGPEM